MTTQQANDLSKSFEVFATEMKRFNNAFQETAQLMNEYCGVGGIVEKTVLGPLKNAGLLK